MEDRNGYVIDTDNIDLQVNLVTPETKSPLGIEFRSSAVSHINLPPEVATSQQERVKFVAYKNSKLFLAKVNPNVGEVIAASVSNKVIKDLRECVRYSLPKPVVSINFALYCIFIDRTEMNKIIANTTYVFNTTVTVHLLQVFVN